MTDDQMSDDQLTEIEIILDGIKVEIARMHHGLVTILGWVVVALGSVVVALFYLGHPQQSLWPF